MERIPLASSQPKIVPLDRFHGGAAAEGIIDFSASINPLGPPQAALDEYHAAAAAIASYPPPYSDRLAARIADWLGISSQELIVGNGSTQLIHLFARVYRLTFPYVAIPTFSEFANSITLSGRFPYALQIGRQHDFILRVEDVQAALRHRAQAVFIGRPNSPTGSMIALGAAAEIAGECERFHALSVFDEAFIDFAGREESAIELIRTVPEEQRKGLVVIGSLTKIFAIPGLRVGFLASRREIIRELRSHLEPWSLNVVAERVALACLAEADQFSRRTREWLRSERRYLADQLSAIGCLRVFRSAANFLMLQVDEPLGAGRFRDFMLEKRIAVRDLRMTPGCEAGFYRVAVLGRADNARLIDAARAYGGEL